MKPMKMSEKGEALIKISEGFRSKPYLCPAGVPTIGYGTTVYANGVPVSLDDKPVTEPQALAIMRNQLPTYENAVNRYVQVPINQNEFDALVSFTYNFGNNAFRTSTLLKKLNLSDYDGAAKEFDRWIYEDRKKSNGLIKRRAAERRLFESAI